jgi:hypothetical protein
LYHNQRIKEEMDIIQGRIFKLEFATSTLCYFGMAICRKCQGAVMQHDDVPLKIVYGKMRTTDMEITYDDTEATMDADTVQPSLYLSSLYTTLQQNLEQKLRIHVQEIQALAALSYVSPQ